MIHEEEPDCWVISWAGAGLASGDRRLMPALSDRGPEV
jgi:hypothetical protein